jgi:hypothetical protein
MRVLKPIKLFFISILIWLFFYVQMPVEYLYSGSIFFPVFTLFLFSFSFIIGISSLKVRSIKFLEVASNKKLKQIIFILFFIGLIGVLLKIYVGIFNTEIFTAEDIFEKRLETMGKELNSGFLGIIASVLFPFAYVTMLMAIYNYKLFSKFILFTIIIVGFYPFVETIFMGGRTIIALLGTTFLFVLFASYNKNSNAPVYKINMKTINLVNLPKILFKKIVFIPLLLITIIFTAYSVDVVNKRLTRFGYGDRTFRVWEQKDYQWVKFDEDFKKEYFRSSEEEKAKLIGYYSLKHYFAHGVVEYVRLSNQLDKTTGYYYGQYQFNVFFKFFRAFGIPLKSNTEMQSVVERKAVYKTFFGPFYIDFGLFGIIIIFFWGRFVKRVYIHAMNGHTQYVIFYGYLATIIITSAFINFLLGSSSYYLFAFFMVLLLFKFWPNNLVFVMKK